MSNFTETQEYIHVHCDRDYKGNIDIRSHIVEKAIKNNKDIIVTCDTLPGSSGYHPKQLKEDRISVSKEFQSKFNSNETYRLYTYEWKGKEK